MGNANVPRWSIRVSGCGAGSASVFIICSLSNQGFISRLQLCFVKPPDGFDLGRPVRRAGGDSGWLPRARHLRDQRWETLPRTLAPLSPCVGPQPAAQAGARDGYACRANLVRQQVRKCMGIQDLHVLPLMARILSGGIEKPWDLVRVDPKLEQSIIWVSTRGFGRSLAP